MPVSKALKWGIGHWASGIGYFFLTLLPIILSVFDGKIDQLFLDGTEQLNSFMDR
ncbi:hypothetical protein [Nostoc sp.]|uniref:hypothetical protein n=1 Tax=Nostoc sp. TaxID=1180 RepID=UPI002FFC81FD